jgi:hypothetical protein
MTTISSDFTIFVTTGAATVVLLYSALLLNRLKSRGGLDRILARTLVDPQSRRSLLRGVSLVTGMFMLMGAITVATNFGLDDVIGDMASATVFCVGAGTLLFQIRTGLNLSKLSLQNELDLRDTQPIIFGALARVRQAEAMNPSPLYLAFPLEQPMGPLAAPSEMDRMFPY